MLRKKTLGLLAIGSLVVIGAMSSDATAGCFTRGYGYGHGYGYRTAVAYARPAIQYAPPIAFAELPQEQLASVPVGSTVTLPANFLGPEPGSVFMVFNHIKLPVQIVNWANEGVTITLPAMAMRHAVKVRVDVVLPHGKLGLRQRLIMTPAAKVVLHPVAPTSPLPTNPALLSAGLIPGE